MDLSESTWLLVKTTPGVTGFIGTGKKPSALTAEEVSNILERTQEARVKPSPKVSFDIGEPVRVTDGPFENFNGILDAAEASNKLDSTTTVDGSFQFEIDPPVGSSGSYLERI